MALETVLRLLPD